MCHISKNRKDTKLKFCIRNGSIASSMVLFASGMVLWSKLNFMSNTAHSQVDVKRWGELNVFTLLRKQAIRHFADTV